LGAKEETNTKEGHEAGGGKRGGQDKKESKKSERTNKKQKLKCTNYSQAQPFARTTKKTPHL
jgi:hypothetical protein